MPGSTGRAAPRLVPDSAAPTERIRFTGSVTKLAGARWPPIAEDKSHSNGMLAPCPKCDSELADEGKRKPSNLLHASDWIRFYPPVWSRQPSIGVNMCYVTAKRLLFVKWKHSPTFTNKTQYPVIKMCLIC